MEEKDHYIEYKKMSLFWTWVILIAYTVATLSYGMIVHMIIPDAPRYWDFGTLPDTPAESRYGSILPPKQFRQKPVVPELPEARPLKNPGPSPDWPEPLKKEFRGTSG